MAVILYKWLMISFLGTGLLTGDALNVTSGKHPFYISVTQVEHNSKQKSVEISCKIFADDFEQALKQQSKKAIDLSNKSNELENNKTINAYILKHLFIMIDGSLSEPKYIGYEKAGEAVHVYFEVPNINSLKKLSVENTLLLDYTVKQVNIVHVTVSGKRQSTKLNFTDTKALFHF